MPFQWPWQYDFPPFFTIQPNLSSREKQLEAWARLIIDYCQFHNIHSLDLNEVAKSEIFNNTRINRSLNEAGIRTVFDYLEEKEHIEWTDKTKKRCRIYWRRPEEWGELLYEWASSNGLLNTVITLTDIIEGEDTANESFAGLEKPILIRAIESLQSQRRAVLVELNNEIGGSTFLRRKELIEEGDTVIIYLNHSTQYSVIVQRGKSLTMKFGALRHDFLIGKRYGSQISATAGYIYALCPTPALWTRALARRTQILYTPDISTILLLLDARPGSVICETGTGSGSLSHALAVAIAPTGHLYTHDIDETRVRQVERELKDHGLDSCTTVVLQDTCEDGFFVENACDGVFLDLPAPWLAIPHAKRALSRVRGGRIVSFSPCIEQVQRACIELEKQGFIKIETIEVVPRNLKAITHVTESLESINSKAGAMEPAITNPRAKKRRLDESNGMDSISAAIPFPAVQPTHTGYLTSATLLPSLEEPNFEPL